MIHKGLIVDDEPIICEGLSSTIPWEQWGIEIVGIAYDGVDAVETLASLDVDFILSDVRMPEMDGLDLAEHVQKHYSHIKMIMMSGYEEFDYAKRALKYGAKDYLLKPVDIDELGTLLQKMQEEDKEEDHKWWNQQVQHHLSTNIVDASVQGNRTLRYRVYGVEIAEYETWLCHLTEEEMADQKALFQKKWLRWADNMQMTVAISHFSDHRLVLCLTDWGDGDIDTSEYDRLPTSLDNILFSWSIVAGHVLTTWSDMRPTVHQVLQKMQYLPSFGPNTILPLNEQIESVEAAALATFADGFANAVLQTKQEMAESLFVELSTLLETTHWRMKDVIQWFQTVETELVKSFTEAPILRFLEGHQLDTLNSTKLLLQAFKLDVMHILEWKKRAATSSRKRLVENALVYIDENYNHDIKAAEVADVINVSPNYFSLLIKQETGHSFSDVLNDARINQTKKLLKETPYKIFEIAGMVGYRDYKYFVSVFKKRTSLTPTEFRNMA
ncbi:response regulator transcription factor [Aureibacillus halotolerans]|uniref:AraC family two component transcriptional regulator n=1 Tax=Aureibacillus halotolerans TaxID=1508390 RepID=A0A4R6U937_9BACI|nr:response regulator [Aureibacillus halotolerans]TDQ42941.1 AraC family two component transcriptional regulator [Aureibacillus halotolerans]